jgi:hypothetical protein
LAQNKSAEKKTGKKENTEAAWKLQAQSVSEEMGLSNDQMAKLSDAYLAAQRSHKQALKELPEEKDKDKSRAATQAVVEKDQAKFAASLKGTLTDELIAKFVPTLGSFNTKWDAFVIVLQDLKLDKPALKSAMKLVIHFVTDYEAASIESMKSFNRRPNSRSFKVKLDAGLSGVLSADQMKTWKEATATSDGKDKSKKGETTNKGEKTKKK